MELTVNTGALSVRDNLTLQARAYCHNISFNMLQLGRVFTEAKEVIPHGEFEDWVRENTDLSLRTAQNMMAAYKRFGGMKEIEGVSQSNMFRLLRLPEGAEEDFLKEHDAKSMTAREVEEAVKRTRNEMIAEVARERQLRFDAEKRAEKAAKNADIPEEVTDELRSKDETIKRQRQELDRLADMNKESIEERRRLESENELLRREADEREEMLGEQQEELNRTQAELLNAQSAMAKGDAERMPADRLTSEVFAGAVRSFLGAVARMPQMKKAFAAMDAGEWNEYDTLLATVEKWAKDSRKALNAAEGAMV